MNPSEYISLEIPYIYEAIIIKPSCRKPSLAVITDVVTVKIKKVTVAEMPLAIKVGKHHISWHDKQLWSPLQCRDEEKTLVTDDRIIENAKNHDSSYKTALTPFKHFWGGFYSPFIGSKHSIKRGYGDSDFYNVTNKPKGDTLHRKWLEDNRKLIIKKAEAIAKTLVSVDGSVFTITGEPYYSITTFGCGNNTTLGLFIHNANENEIKLHLTERFNFSALFFDEALKYARDYAATIGDTRCRIMGPNCGQTIEVLIPDAITPT
jgi:hypothetical protein